MNKKLKVLAIIPARGGSKGIIDKNIVALLGKPLIYYSIAACKEAKKVAKCIVSTDSERIAQIASKYGAEVPFLRPANLAEDDTPTLPVILHALDFLGNENYDAILLLQPTSPFRTAEDIDLAIEMMACNEEADSVVSVTNVEGHHPARMKKLTISGWLENPPFAEAIEGQRRQELPEYYIRNGAIYLTRKSVVKEKKSIAGSKSLGFVMPKIRSINIDTELDLIVAEILAQKFDLIKDYGN